MAFHMTKSPTERLSGSSRGALAGLTAAVIWGAYLSFSRAGVAAGLDGIDVAFLRYVVAGPVMLAVLLARQGPVRLDMTIGQAATVAVLLGPPFVLLSVGGYAYAPLAHGAVIVPATLTLGGLLLARIVLGERLGLGRIIGACVIVTGLILVAGPGILHGSVTSLIGDAMFLAAGFLWSIFGTVQQRWRLAAVDVVTAVSLVGLVAVVPAYLILRGTEVILSVPVSVLAVQILVQGLLSGVIAMIAYAKAVSLLGAARASTFPALVPGFALLIGIPLVNEWPAGIQFVGLALVAVGLAVVLTRKVTA